MRATTIGMAARRAKAGWLRLPQNTRAAVWIFLSATTFAMVDSLAKGAGQTLPLVQLVFFRYLFGILFLAPSLIRLGPTHFRTHRLGFHLVRTLTSTSAQFLTWYAVIHMFIADATAIFFARPLFTTLLAAVFLGELVNGRRWSATAVGFVGVLIMVRPGTAGVDLAALAAVGGTLLFGIAIIQTRILGRSDSPISIVFYYQSFSIAIYLIPTIIWWQTPTPAEWAMLVGLAAFGTAAQVMGVRGFAMGEISIVGPMEYIRLVAAALIGYFVFAELPDAFTFVGAGIIVAATFYISIAGARKTRPRRIAE